MPILSEGYLNTRDLMQYVKEKHNRHWNRSRISSLIKKKAFTPEIFGRHNIFDAKDIDKYIASLKRLCASGKRGVKYKD